ncbi:uncharacterized protein LOC109838505 [Asparagus officinalis]|uniref:uncharacterized protein LOC109838505 n=1 Tax=Asparagus officinalis TaxID=4686 RepID=UPI00098E841E|nr:uncharacterized protein LOC109838505 [Asparagus officinalis]
MESSVGVGSTEAGPVAGTDTTIVIGTSNRLEDSELVPWTGTEVNLQSSIPEFQPATPMDPMMIEVTRILSLAPPSSEALIEKASDVAGASTTTIPESTLVVPEIRLPSSGELSHAEGSSIELVPSSSLSDRIRALLADEDPDKAGICSDLDGFISFLNSMVDRILSKGSRFESFKKPLDRYISGIRDEGYNDLADSINAYMVDLKQHVDLLRGLRTESVPSYIASRMDSKLQALRDSQTSANLELQQLRAHSDQLRMNVGKRIQAQVNLRRDLESSRAEIARLEEELAMAKDAHDVLESELKREIHTEGNLLQQLNLQDQMIAEKEQEIAALHNVDEEAFKIKLAAELEQARALELSKLENQISQYKLL